MSYLQRRIQEQGKEGSELRSMECWGHDLPLALMVRAYRGLVVEMQADKHYDPRTVSPYNSCAYHELDVLVGLSSLWKAITRCVENILQSLRVC